MHNSQDILMNSQANREIIEILLEIPQPTTRDVSLAKMKVAERHNLKNIPSNSELISCLEPNEKDKLLPVLRRKITRTISGVTVVAVMTKPWPFRRKNHARIVQAVRHMEFLKAIRGMNQPR